MAKLYFYSSSSSNWNVASNWWLNQSHTTPAGRNPVSTDDIIILADSISPSHPYSTNGGITPLIYNSLSCLKNFGDYNSSLITFSTSAIFVNSTFCVQVSAGTGIYLFGNSTFTGWDYPDIYGSTWYRDERNIYAPNIYFYDTSRAASVVNGTSYFYNSAANTSALAFNGVVTGGNGVNGNTYFYNNSKTETSINGNAYFYNNSTSVGYISLTAFYYDSSLMKDSTVAGFLDLSSYKNIEVPYKFYSNNGVKLGFITSRQFTLTGSQNFLLGSTRNNSNGPYDFFNGNISNNATVFNSSYQPVTSFVFQNSSTNIIINDGFALFRNYILPNAAYYDYSSNQGFVLSGTFNDFSSNLLHISGSATFNNNALNRGIVTTTASFNNSSINTLSGSTSIGYFYNNSYNNGFVNTGYFYNSAYNTGTISTSAYYYNNNALKSTLYINSPKIWSPTTRENFTIASDNTIISAVNINNSYNSGTIPFTTYFTGSSYNIGRVSNNTGFLSAGLISFWNFDNPSVPGFDSGPNNNTLPVTVSPPLTTGRILSGLNLGIHAYDNRTAKTVLPGNNQDFTITFWHYGVVYNVSGFSGLINSIWTNITFDGTWYNSFYFGTWNDFSFPSPLSAVVFVGFMPNSAQSQRGLGQDISRYGYMGSFLLNQWYFYSIRANYTSGFVEIRQNNKVVFCCKLQTPSQWPSVKLWSIPGAPQTGPGEALDMIGVWSRILSDDELNYLYNNRNGNNFSSINNTVITPTTYFNDQSYNGNGGQYINVVYNSVKKGVNGPSLLI